jgi:hypothetical protein
MCLRRKAIGHRSRTSLAVAVKAPEIAREVGRGACDALPEVPELGV